MSRAISLSKLTIRLHWLIAVGMIGSLAFGIYLDEFAASANKGSLIGLHKSVGVIVLLLALVRLVNTAKQGLPTPLSESAAWQLSAAKVTHILLLAGTLFMPISGVMMSVGGGYPVGVFGLPLIPAGDENEMLSQIGHAVHGVGANIMIAAVLLHVAGAVKHSLIDKDGTMARMLGKQIGNS